MRSWQHDRGLRASSAGAHLEKLAPSLYDANRLLRVMRRRSKSIAYEEYDNYNKPLAFVKVEDGQFRLGKQVLYPAGRHVALSTLGSETSIYRFIRVSCANPKTIERHTSVDCT